MAGLSDFDSPMSKFFTIYHTSIGVLFAGVTVLFIAQEVGKNKDNWIMQIIKVKELDAAAETEGFWDSVVGHMKVHFPTLRIIALFIVWFAFGLLWFPFTNSDYTVAKNVDFMLSTLTTGGYMAIPSSVGGYQLVVTALYANFGVPLLSIAMGACLLACSCVCVCVCVCNAYPASTDHTIGFLFLLFARFVHELAAGSA
jgi:hypothetical protein